MSRRFTEVDQRVDTTDSQSAAALHTPEGLGTASNGEDSYRNLHFEDDFVLVKE